MYRYALELIEEDDGITVYIPAFEVYTCGENRQEALDNAQDALDESVAGRILYEEDIPESDSAGAAFSVEVSPYLVLKAALYEGLRASGLSKNALARKIGVGENEIRRMLNPAHSTKFERLIDALEAVGRRVRVKVERLPRAA